MSQFARTLRIPSISLAGWASAILVCALGALSFHWTLALMYPEQPDTPPAASSPQPEVPGKLESVAQSFAPANPEAPKQSPLTSLDVQLIGAVQYGKRGRAVITNAGEKRTLGVGEELVSGVVLADVGRDFIELRASGESRRIELLDPKKAGTDQGAKP